MRLGEEKKKYNVIINMMDAHLSERPAYPEYTVPTWRMRRMMDRYRKEYHALLFDPATQSEQEAMYEEYVKMLWRQECDDAFAQGKLKAIKEKSYVAERQQSEKSNVYWVTVNPKPDVPFEILEKEVTKYVNQKHVQGAEYVYEQRGASPDEAGHLPHVHMLVRTNTKNGDFIKRTTDKFKNIIGNTKHVWIKNCPKAYIPDKRAYMKGHKTGDGKDVKCEIDYIWRQKNNLQPYYIIGTLEDADVSQEEDQSSDPSQESTP